jgi:hypothetical protein
MNENHSKLFSKFIISSCIIGLISIFFIELIRMASNGSIAIHAISSGIIYFFGIFASYYSQQKWVHNKSTKRKKRLPLFIFISLLISGIVSVLSGFYYEALLSFYSAKFSASASLIFAALSTSPASYFTGYYTLRDTQLAPLEKQPKPKTLP